MVLCGLEMPGMGSTVRRKGEDGHLCGKEVFGMKACQDALEVKILGYHRPVQALIDRIDGHFGRPHT